MTRRVLIVTSTYAPAMTADMHRARHLAWELPSLGWEVEILCPDSAFQLAYSMDSDSTAFFAPGTVVHEVSPKFAWVARALGLGGIGWRAFVPMFLAGLALLKKERYDIVYLSTTHVPLFILGAAWRRFRETRYVLDVQDPIYKEGSSTPVWSKPRVKHWLARQLAKRAESISVPRAAGLVSVSPAYIETLEQRYAHRHPEWMAADRHAVIPFPVSMRDLDEVSRSRGSKPPRDTHDIVYVGAGGPIMERSFSRLCEVLARSRTTQPALFETVRIAIRGTVVGWKDGNPKYLGDIATRHGIGDLVDEDPRRISFRHSIEMLVDGDGALVLGIDGAGYMPSKLFSYAGSRKPLLAVLHRRSPAFRQFHDTPGLGHAIWFDDAGEQPIAEACAEVEAFLGEVLARKEIDRTQAIAEFDARSMARRHVKLFEACL